MKEKIINLARDIFWCPLQYLPPMKETKARAIDTFPVLQDVYSSAKFNDVGINPYNIPVDLLKVGAIDDLMELYSSILATEPEFMIHRDRPDERGDYVFESIGSSIIELKTHLLIQLNEGGISDQQFYEFYNLTSKFDMYASETAEHPFMTPLYLKQVFNAGQFPVFDALYTTFREQGRSNAIVILAGVENLMGPFYQGDMVLHRKIVRQLEESLKVDKFAVKKPAVYFWKEADKLVDFLVASNNKDLWKEALRLGGSTFSVAKLSPLKQAAKDGSAFLALKGEVDLFLAAKRQGYSMDAEDYRCVIDSIERLSKALGAGWSRTLSMDVCKNMADLFEGADKDEIMGKKKATHLIESLNELMPGKNWMDYSTKSNRGAILANQLGL